MVSDRLKDSGGLPRARVGSSQFRRVVVLTAAAAAAVEILGDVAGQIAVVVHELVAARQQFRALALRVAWHARESFEVAGGAVDGGRRLAVAEVGCAQLLCPGQVFGQDGDERVGGLSAVGRGGQQRSDGPPRNRRRPRLRVDKVEKLGEAVGDGGQVGVAAHDLLGLKRFAGRGDET